jgi:hypothetical protein
VSDSSRTKHKGITNVVSISSYMQNINNDNQTKMIYPHADERLKLDAPKHFLDDSDQGFELKTHNYAKNVGIPEIFFADFTKTIFPIVKSYRQRLLPEHPIRQYRRGEDLISYIRSPEGLGPWVDANALNRPLIRDLSPGAYMALAEYLRKHELPNDLNIPTKSEVLKTEKITPEAIKAARRLLSRVQREKSSTEQSR